ncbi:MAG: sulfite exporter TauE/SafE family protein [Anaerolineae bacterium]|nr:sulfite exporter TauE/SafE family protein [Anaerolineae bacterium]
MPPSLVLLLAALIIGLTKGGLAGLGGLVLPLLSTIMPVSQAVGLSLPMLMIGDAIALRVYWREWDGYYLRLMLPAAAGGILLGILLLNSLPDIVLRRALGVFTLLAVLYTAGRHRIATLRYKPHAWHGVLSGGTVGFVSALANAGGPPASIYLLLQNLKPLTFLGTITLLFTVINLLKLPLFLSTNVIDLEELARMIWLLPAIPVGVWAGKQLLKRFNQQTFEVVMLILLTYSGISLLR